MSIAPEFMYGVGAVLIAAGLLVGWMMYNTRNRANDPRTEAATREQYRQAEDARKRDAN